MERFVISDTHFGHSLFVREGLRPFSSVEDMDEAMVENWNSAVTKRDEVFFVGDFALAPAFHAFGIFNRLNGRKHLIRGNHDSNPVCAFEWASVDWIKNVKHTYNGVKHKIIFCHYPLETWPGKSHGFVHIHGHTHAGYIRQVPNRFNASVEVQHYAPMLLDDQLKRTVTGEQLRQHWPAL